MRLAYRPSALPLLRAAGVLLALLVMLTACDALGGTGSSPTPRGSARPSASARPTAEPSLPPGAVVLEVRNRQFSTDVIEGVAGVPTLVYFTNHDDMNHNLTVYRNASLDLELFRGEIFSGPDATVVYEIPAQPAGTYYFACYVVPSMHGQFIVR
jgi:plastocyanin